MLISFCVQGGGGGNNFKNLDSLLGLKPVLVPPNFWAGLRHWSRACQLRLSDASAICHVIYFQFPTQSAFLPYIGGQAVPALRRSIGFNTQ